MRAFVPAELVEACRRAATEADPVAAVGEVIESTVRRHGSTIDDVLGRTPSVEPNTLFCSRELTVQRIAWPGGSASPPHEHRMWAVVGVYAGREVNTVFDREGGRIAPSRTVAVEAGRVFSLPATAVHAVHNPERRWTAGLHVYGGDIVNVARSSWLPDGTEAPQSEVTEQRRAMVQAMRDLAVDLGREISSDDRYVALSALWRETERLHRNLTPAEARAVVAGAWNLTT